jgi:phosphate-selective porin OprO/OprP
MYAKVDGKNGATSPDFDGFYIQGSYFLTGEHRKYKTSTGAFDRVKPKENFSSASGTGAWEVAARYSQIDLNEGSVTGGRLRNVTVGLNWHLNPNMRIMWNYIRADLSGVGKASLFLMRFQIDF